MGGCLVGVVFFLRNLVVIAVGVAAVAYLVRRVAKHAGRAIDKVAEEHDVEKLSTAEILARKYERESR